MAVKKTQYTKQELIKLAEEQEFGTSYLVNGDQHCALGWLLSLTGVHNSRMTGLSVLYNAKQCAPFTKPIELILGINSYVASRIYMRNDGASHESRGRVVAWALRDFLPRDYVLNECEEKFKGELKG